MSIIIDLVIVAIIALCVFLGYRRGLTGSLLKIVSFILALVIAFILFKPVSSFIINNTNWDENLEQAIRENLMKEESTESVQEGEEKGSMPEVIVNYINKAVEDAGNEAKNTIVDAAARDVAITIINVAVLIGLYFIARVTLLLVRGLTSLITKLPVIKQFDKLGGIVYGLLQSLIIIYVILAIVSFASPMMQDSGVIEGIQKSFVGSALYNNNLLLKIML